MEHENNRQSKLDHILCSASNCVYNSEGSNQCTAAHIDIGGQIACCSGETCCKTFKMK